MATDVHTASREQLLEHADWLRTLARALVRDSGDADDLAQETYEAALINPPKSDRPLQPWLAGVMRNLVRFRSRGIARRQRREQAATRLERTVATPEELVARVETQQIVAEIVVGLDEPFRSTILLRYYEGFSAADIARNLNIPAGTVRWRLKRGLEQLRSRLDDSYEGGRHGWLAALSPLGVPLPKPVAAGSALTSFTQGLLVMKTTTKFIVAGAVLIGLLTAGYLAGIFGTDPTQANEAPLAGKSDRRDSSTAQLRPALRFQSPAGGEPSVTLAALDVPGTLRLEGQVIDDDERAVAGATVAIATNPVRQTVTEQDGSFHFDNLGARMYKLEARSGGLHATAGIALTRASDPVILRARAGGKVTVHVRSASDNKPVASATVELRSTLMWQARSDASGTVEFDGVGPGWRRLKVTAKGYASATRMITSASRRATNTVVVLLERGTAVAGTVVDESGTAIAGARVWATFASEPFPTIDPRIDAVVSDARGQWSMPALATGTYHFTAAHPDYAQTSSSAFFVTAKAASLDVALTLRSGGVLRGIVVGKSGPVVGAAINVVAKGSLAWRFRSQATTGADGRFSLGGLPLRALEVIAVHDSGSSKIQSVDLSAAAKVREVTLELSVVDAIAGVVVDGEGDVVADATVTISPVYSGALGERRAWQVRNQASRSSDKHGAFRFSGLPKATYVVRAARPGALPNALALHPGVKASPGGTDLRVKVPGETNYHGRVRLADGTVPRSFTVQLGRTAPTPFVTEDGAFSIAAPAGKFVLRVAGPTFVATTLEVSGKQEEANDLGVIKVERGRSVTGIVVDSDGAPVANADVAAGRLLTGGGRQLNIRSEGRGVHTTTTDDQGLFVISGFDVRPFTVVAGVAGKGRSASFHAERGSKDVEVRLTLMAVGSLSGRATMDGKPLAQTVVVATPRRATLSNFFVVTADDGSFALDSLTPGEYIVQVMLGGGGKRPKDMYMQVGTVVAGQRATVDVALQTGAVEVKVVAKTDNGAPVSFAMVALAMGKLDGTPNLEVARNNYPKGNKGAFYLRMAFGGGPVTIAGIPAGTYSACVVPITNPAMLRNRDLTQQAPTKCVSKVLTAGMTSATYTVVVPSAWLE